MKTKEYYNYLIYENGNIYSNKSKRFIKPYKHKSGYLVMDIYINKKRKVKYIHRILAECFLENKDNKKCINHKDGNKENNNLSNLEWCTYQENSIHAFKNGLNKISDKAKERCRKMGKSHSPEKRLEMAKLGGFAAGALASKKVYCYKTKTIFPSISEAAKHLNIRNSTLARYLKGTRKNKTTLTLYNEPELAEHMIEEIKIRVFDGK